MNCRRLCPPTWASPERAACRLAVRRCSTAVPIFLASDHWVWPPRWRHRWPAGKTCLASRKTAACTVCAPFLPLTPRCTSPQLLLHLFIRPCPLPLPKRGSVPTALPCSPHTSAPTAPVAACRLPTRMKAMWFAAPVCKILHRGAASLFTGYTGVPCAIPCCDSNLTGICTLPRCWAGFFLMPSAACRALM